MLNRVIVILVILGIFSCKQVNSEKEKLNFCQMLNDDQELKGQQRHNAFKANFNSIIEYTKLNGFPNFDFNSLPQDSCKTWAIMGTLIHIVQSSPESVFKPEIIDLLSIEIGKGNLDPEDIYPAFKISTGGNQIFCDSLRPYIEETFVKWKMDIDLKSGFKYENCEN